MFIAWEDASEWSIPARCRCPMWLHLSPEPRKSPPANLKSMRCEEIDVHIIAVDALLIDCDGVLVDSHNAAAPAWNGWARRWSPAFDFHRDIEHGRRITDVVADLVDPHDVDEAAAARIQPALIAQ